LYHLRLLLLNVPGATSFQHLRTVNGFPHATFTDAARALNLVENGQQWYDAMAEAAQHQMPYQLR
jgi:ATP-dependent DNA helicase PIF1